MEQEKFKNMKDFDYFKVSKDDFIMMLKTFVLFQEAFTHEDKKRQLDQSLCIGFGLLTELMEKLFHNAQPMKEEGRVEV